MIKFLALSLLVNLGCGSRPNRACILANNALKVDHSEGSCEPVSYGETRDYANWFVDDGELLCFDNVGAERPLTCSVKQPTKTQRAADAKTKAEAEAKANAEIAAKLKVEAEAKARADAAGSGSAKGAPKP